MFKLRDYQQELKDAIYKAWGDGFTNVCAVSPCGSGKTVLFSCITHDEPDPVCVIVHRQELVEQISVSLARCGVRHNIIAPRTVIKTIVKSHVRATGRNFYEPRSVKAVAGVDTLLRRKDLDDWRKSVKLWIQDECHHVLASNKWGKAAAMFPNARGLGVTATPERADGKGLGRHADGVFDTMVEGKTLRWMIDQGYLTDYKIYAPPSDIDFSGLKINRAGDYDPKAIRDREIKSHIVGDVVKHFRKLAPGKQGITYNSCVKTAQDMAQQFTAEGVPAVMVCGETKDRDRANATREFKSRNLLQMTNVDLFGEGYDLPALDCVSLVRKTESFSLFVQQVTRALRPCYAEGMPLDTREQRLAAIAAGPKPYAIIIDHVGNVARHAVAVNGVIDLCHRDWTLDARERKGSSKPDDAIPVKTCPECISVYERLHKVCPFCGFEAKPAERSEPQQVDGDLTELDPSTLTQIKQEVERIQAPAKVPQHLTGVAAAGLRKKHRIRQEAHIKLKDAIGWFGAYKRAEGMEDHAIYKLFFFKYGIDVLSAQTLSAKDADQLTTKILEDLNHVTK